MIVERIFVLHHAKKKQKRQLLLRWGILQKGRKARIWRALLFSPEPPQTVSNPVTTPSDVVSDKTNAILAYLQRIEETIQSLNQRMSDLDSIKSHTSTPQGPRSQSSAVKAFAMQVQPPIYTQPLRPAIVHHNTRLAPVSMCSHTIIWAIHSAPDHTSLTSSLEVDYQTGQLNIITSLNTLR